MRYQEAGGIQLARMFSTELAKGQHCGREDCQPCGTGEKRNPNSKQSNIVYESRCKACNKEKDASSLQEGKENDHQEKQIKKGIYIGETSRSLFERSREHVKNAMDLEQGSHMVKHWLSVHGEEKECPQFVFKILGTYKDCLSRQVSEAVKIHYSPDELLNSKNEYNANCIARVCVDETKFEKKKREKMESIEESRDKKAWEEFKDKHAGNRKRKNETIP